MPCWVDVYIGDSSRGQIGTSAIDICAPLGNIWKTPGRVKKWILKN